MGGKRTDSGSQRSTSHSYVTSPVRAAKETDFYRVDSSDIDPNVIPPLLFEKALGEIEGHAQSAFETLIQSGPDDLDPRQALDMGIYLGVQYARGQSVRRQIQHASHSALVAWFEAMPDNQIAEMLRTQGPDCKSRSKTAAPERVKT